LLVGFWVENDEDFLPFRNRSITIFHWERMNLITPGRVVVYQIVPTFTFL
jgi:hypothetical protein